MIKLNIPCNVLGWIKYKSKLTHEQRYFYLIIQTNTNQEIVTKFMLHMNNQKQNKQPEYMNHADYNIFDIILLENVIVRNTISIKSFSADDLEIFIFNDQNYNISIVKKNIIVQQSLQQLSQLSIKDNNKYVSVVVKIHDYELSNDYVQLLCLDGTQPVRVQMHILDLNRFGLISNNYVQFIEEFLLYHTFGFLDLLVQSLQYNKQFKGFLSVVNRTHIFNEQKSIQIFKNLDIRNINQSLHYSCISSSKNLRDYKTVIFCSITIINSCNQLIRRACQYCKSFRSQCKDCGVLTFCGYGLITMDDCTFEASLSHNFLTQWLQCSPTEYFQLNTTEQQLKTIYSKQLMVEMITYSDSKEVTNILHTNLMFLLKYKIAQIK